MNDVKKGAVTAIIATAVTSAMILMSGTGSADNSQSATGKDQSASNEKTTIKIIQENDVVAEVVSTETASNSESNALFNKGASNADLPPPPGLFSKEDTGVLVKPQAPKPLSPPVSPEAPRQSVINKPEIPEAPKNIVEKPAQKEKAPVAPMPLKKFDIKPAEKAAPVMTAKIPAVPFAPEIRSFQPELIKSPQLPNNKLTTNQQKPKAPIAPQGSTLQNALPKINNSGQPIWMQGNNYDSAKITPQAAQDVNKRLNHTKGMHMPNSQNGIRYMQQYRYMPMPVYPNYHYPQAPQYNAGYYFAPIPNQWMQQGMQMPMKQNQFAPAVNEQKGLSK